MRRNKKWYEVTVCAKNGEKVFDNNTSSWTVIAKVQSLGNAYTVAEALKKSYKPEWFSIVVE